MKEDFKTDIKWTVIDITEKENAKLRNLHWPIHNMVWVESDGDVFYSNDQGEIWRKSSKLRQIYHNIIVWVIIRKARIIGWLHRKIGAM